MAWQPATRRDMDDLLTFLKPREWSCVAFTSRLIARETNIDHVLVNRAAGSERSCIVESLLVTDQGLIVPVLEPRKHGSEAQRKLLKELIASRARHVYSVMGLRSQVGVVESLLAPRSAEQIDYHLMTREYDSVAPPVKERPGMVIRRAGIVDLTTIFPLQRSYEKEEVLLEPDSFNATSCLLHLQRSLRREITLVAELDGKIVAKAGTNAQGLDYYQIGGVFTEPEHRNQGIARMLLRGLLGEITALQKHACLFVKKHNEAAIHLYRSLGFQIRDDFAISYHRL